MGAARADSQTLNRTHGRIALLAIDLDGTLLTSDGRVTDASVEAVSRAQALGVEVVPVSARPPFGMRAAIDRLGLRGYLIAYNGAYLASQASGEVLLHQPMAAEDAAAIVRLAREHRLYAGYYVGSEWYVERVCDEMVFEQRSLNYTPIIVTDLLTDAPRRPDKFIVISLSDAARLSRFTEAAGTAMPHLNVHYSSRVSIEIGDPGASKASALEFLAGRLGVPRESVMAIGDSYNDLSMLEFAGVSVAVGNAPPEVRGTASLVVASNDADGVAQAIRRVILGEPAGAERRRLPSS